MGLTACTLRRKTMYKSTDYEHEQLSFINFNMACGMQLDMNNEWIRIAQQLPWKAWEALYVAIFPSNTGNVAKPCRMVLGSLILQMRLGFTDRELVDQLRQNPYYQYFIGLPSPPSTRLRSHGHCCINNRSPCMTTRRIRWITGL